MPEKLDDGLLIADVVQDYLAFAPMTGPLFQTVKSGVKGQWSGKGWTTGVITSKLRDALRDVRMGLDWKEQEISLYSAHSFRATAASSMSAGGAELALVASALNHAGTAVTFNRYVHYSKEKIRNGLSFSGGGAALK